MLSSQAGLASWGGYLYLVGGSGSGGPSSGVWRTSVSNGTQGPWIREADLPVGLEAPSVWTANQQIYVLGGKTATGLSSAIYFTYINPDGHLGYSNSFWQTNLRSLPEAQAGAAVFEANGRLFLCGGQTASGATNHVWNAQLWKDGEIGEWYAATPLPWSDASPSAVSWGGPSGTVWVTGAQKSAQASFTLNTLPWSWVVNSLPQALDVPLLADTPSGVLLAGLSQSSGKAMAWINSGSGWQYQYPGFSELEGPNAVKVGGVLWTVASTSPPGLTATPFSFQPFSSQAEVPRISPPSGTVPVNTLLRVTATPGDQVTWTSAPAGTVPADPTTSSSDTLWSSTTPAFPKVTSSTTYAFRAFRSGASASRIVYETYTLLSNGLFALVSGTLTPGTSTLTTYSLIQVLSSGNLAVNSVVYSLTVYQPETLTLTWADKTTSSTYTAPITLSLRESDLMTPVQLPDGSVFSSRTDDALTVTLQPGTYYLTAASTDGSTGGTFGLAVSAP